jgi:hypothetical protein
MLQKNYFKILLSTVCLLNYSTVHGQFSPKSIRVSFANEALILPSWKIYQSPINPTLLIGIDTKIKSNKNWQTAKGIELGYFYQRSNESALMLDINYAKGYKIGRIQPMFLAAIGAKQILPYSEAFRLKDGQYEKSRAFGRTQLATKLGLGLAYALSEKVSISTDYKVMLSLPYSKNFPFSPHTFLGVGLRINLQKN